METILFWRRGRMKKNIMTAVEQDILYEIEWVAFSEDKKRCELIQEAIVYLLDSKYRKKPGVKLQKPKIG
jgi:hypothetical protein